MQNLLYFYTRKPKSFKEKFFSRPPSGSVTEKAHAKINLYLQVLRKREDGYHDLDSLIAFCELHDRITIRHAKTFMLVADSSFSFRLPETKDNLITKIVHAVAEEVGEKPNLLVELHKNIPVAAGLGGGSADAAAVLRALGKLWNFSLDQINLQALMEMIGSDVPVCLFEKPAFVEGRGEIITTAPALPKCPVVLVNPNLLLETKQVFQNLTVMPRTPIEKFTTPPATVEALVDLVSPHQNDLMAVASNLQPETLKVFRALSKTQGCLLPRLSGSGPTCFGIFKDKKSAFAAAELIKKENPGWWVQPTFLLAGKPV